MTKEQLQNERDNYMRLYKSEKEKREELENEKFNIEKYEELNLQLQCRVFDLKKQVDDLSDANRYLAKNLEIYETVFNVLKENNKDG